MGHKLTALELQQDLPAENATIIDLRSPSEFATGHIAGAINIPLPELEPRRGEIRGDRLVFVCERGIRAQTARAALARCFPHTQVLEGGMHAWRQAGLPIIQVTKTTWSLERQVRLIAGTLVLIGVVLGLTLGPLWSLVAAIPGAGLVFAGLTDFCPTAILLTRMPWNQLCSTSVQNEEVFAEVK